MDNFDVNVEKITGGGSVNTTHLIAFQEQDNNGVPIDDIMTTQKMKQRRINVDTTNLANPTIDKKKTLLNYQKQNCYLQAPQTLSRNTFYG